MRSSLINANVESRSSITRSLSPRRSFRRITPTWRDAQVQRQVYPTALDGSIWRIAPAVLNDRSTGRSGSTWCAGPAGIPPPCCLKPPACSAWRWASLPSLAQDAYFRQVLSQDPKAPIAFKYFEDYNERNSNYYGVRTGARHPAAATLFALWITSVEAQGIWQTSEFSAVPHGESKIDKEHQLAIQNAKARVVGFLDNEKTIELLKWYQDRRRTKISGRNDPRYQGRMSPGLPVFS